MMAVESIRSEALVHRKDMLIALGTSLLVHGVFFGVWLLVGVAILAAHSVTVEKLKELQLAEERRAREEPQLVFVEVSPDQAAPEPPKEAKFYSSANSQAANPDATLETNVPKLEGDQDKVAKTRDTERPRPQPLQPSPPPEPTPPETAALDEPKPEQKEKPGDLAMAKPLPEEPPKRERPRRLAEVKRQDETLAGQRMKQDGGVKRRALVSSLDVKSTPFGAYDAAIIAAIQQRWYQLLDESNFPPRKGHVVIEFRMYSDGRVTDLKVSEEDVGEILAVFCRRAISDPAPYAPWPSDMRRMIGKEYREVKFTFFYL